MQAAFSNVATMPIDYFIDETFHAPSNPGGSHFYVFALVGLERENLRHYREELRRLVVRSRWHSSEMLGKQSGRDRFRKTVMYFSEFAHLHIFVVNQIPEADRTGENTRRKLITFIVRNMLTRDSESFLIFENRGSSGQKNQDLETLRGTLSLEQRSKVRFLEPANEELLWLPDMLASAYRYHLTGKSNELFEMFVTKPEVIMV